MDKLQQQMDKRDPSAQGLSFLEAVKRRPGMYLGKIDYSSAILHIMDGFLSDPPVISPFTLKIVFHDDQSFTVEEDKGILQIKGEELPEQFRLPDGLFIRHVLGVIRAVSTWIIADIWHEKHYQFKFANGELVQPVTDLGATERQGSRLHFLLDAQIFDKSDDRIDFHQLLGRARSLAACLPGVRIRLVSEPDNLSSDSQYKNGLEDYLSECLDEVRGYFYPPISFNAVEEFGRVSVALGWMDSKVENATIFTFINGKRSHMPGAHTVGLQSALYKIATLEHERTEDASRRYFVNKDSVFRGLICAMSLWLDNLSRGDFDDSAGLELITPKARELIERAVMDNLPKIFAENPKYRTYFMRAVRLNTNGD